MYLRKNKNIKIGIVIPTYQEENNIKKVFKKFSKIKKYNFFFCFVDGSYDDKTKIEIKRYFKSNFKIINQKKTKISFFNLSKRCQASELGFKWIIKNTKVDLIADMDADLSSDPNDILKAFRIYKRKNPDLIIGSKYLLNSRVMKRKIFRIVCSKIYTFVCKIIISNTISDYSAGYRFFKRKPLSNMLIKKPLFNSPARHLENLLFFYENNLTICEFPAKYSDTNENSKSILFHHVIIIAFQLSLVLLNYYFRKFRKFFI
tara:strand:- start:1319 stop:2098 length:780 start_codon:yes stop_codon:yes gene_type:complete